MEMSPVEEKIATGGFALAGHVPDCPVCGGRSIWWCRWYSPKGHEYYICARCDMKASEEEYFKKIVSKLDELEAERDD